MNLARITAKGQITIPIEIRKSLGVKEGDKVVFIEGENGIILANSNKVAWENIQQAMEGEAEKAGFQSEEDVVQFCKEIRKENWEKNYANND
jgi:AbrB family looped-hinge helix DNA binding protein